MFAVRIARRSNEVCNTSGRRPASRSNSPPRRASASPVSLRSTSTQPVNRFFWFQSLSPGRSRIKVGTLDSVLRHGESDWNQKNLFTGWVDVDLSDTGEAEARRGVAEGFAAAAGLSLPGIAQVDVHPAGEQVLLVPVALAVTEQD